MRRIFWNKKNVLNMIKTLFLIIKMILKRLQTHSITKLTSFKIRLRMKKIKESNKCLIKISQKSYCKEMKTCKHRVNKSIALIYHPSEIYNHLFNSRIYAMKIKIMSIMMMNLNKLHLDSKFIKNTTDFMT
jgi:hypothetical protein